eukprot:797589-Lingulodinium_polyedra.AAC.1
MFYARRSMRNAQLTYAYTYTRVRVCQDTRTHTSARAYTVRNAECVMQKAEYAIRNTSTQSVVVQLT